MRITNPPDDLAALLAGFDAGSAGPVVSRLTLATDAQRAIPRLTLLLHWALLGARGEEPATSDGMCALLARLEEEDDVPDEIDVADAVQDEVFLHGRGFRVFTGPHAGVGHVVRRLLVCAEDCDIDRGRLNSAEALLSLSDAIAGRGLVTQASANESGEGGASRFAPLDEEPTCFTAANLRTMGIAPADLAPFRLPGSSTGSACCWT